MASKEKKVILFIVEGPSDESAIGPVMKAVFKDKEVRFHVVHGDLATKENTQNSTVISKVNECMEQEMRKYRYHIDDFEAIVHVTDLDGVFVDEGHVVEKKVPELRYYPDHMETAYRERVIRRNHTKADILCKLFKTSKVHGIPYRIYYMSCNLEHVLFHVLENMTDVQKWELSDRFSEEYEKNPEAFISFFENSDLAVEGTYQDTWKYIQKEEHSLNRYSNLYLLFNMQQSK